MSTVTEKITVILDSNAFINYNTNLFENVSRYDFYCLKEIETMEIRDIKAKELFKRLKPYITMMYTNDMDSSEVLRFSNETGDIATLSKIDIKVLILCRYLQNMIDPKKLKGTPINTVEYNEGKSKTSALPGWDKWDGLSSKLDTSNENSSDLDPKQVYCATTDFPMQNTLIQMGIKVLAPDGSLIKQLRTWVQRCYGCYNIEKSKIKQFCSICGGSTLSKVSCSINNETNKIELYLKKDYQRIIKNNSPSQVKNAHIYLVREDQPAYIRAMKKYHRDMKKALNGDDIHDLPKLPIIGIPRTTKSQK